jgi:hypothetical protein
MQEDSIQFERMLELAHRNHLYAEFLLGWIALPASEERCEQACDILVAVLKMGEVDAQALVDGFQRAFRNQR